MKYFDREMNKKKNIYDFYDIIDAWYDDGKKFSRGGSQRLVENDAFKV